MMQRDFNMKYKIGDKIRMKKNCYDVRAGIVLTVKKHPNGFLYVGKKDAFCSHHEFWQLIKSVKKPSKPKVCKHKWQIFQNGLSEFTAICTVCLEKKYI